MRSSAPITRTSTPATASAPRTARSGWASTSCCSARSGPATGWIARAQRLVDREGRECVERGYLLIPAMFRHEAAGDLRAAAAVAGEALAIGDRFGDRDLFALAAQSQGTFLVMEGEVEEGVTLLDEAMVAVSARRAVADRQRARLLRRDPRMPGRV